MQPLNLTAAEARVLGCLLEKERITPENYPLSLNSITMACNQTTSREPVVSFDERTVEDALASLRERKLATVLQLAGARVQKFRHNLLNQYQLEPPEVALITVLLLRGPQTPGELRGRTERMHSFGSLQEVETCLEGLGRGDDPMVRILPPRPGQKERRYVELLSVDGANAEAKEATGEFTAHPSTQGNLPPSLGGRVDSLEREVAELKAELQRVRDEFATFRKQFE